MSKELRKGLLCAAALVLGGCAPKAELSGWEIARKKGPGEKSEAFPELPVVLAPSISAAAGAAPASPPNQPQASMMDLVLLRKLDEGSLFRRGYGAPTP
jgi:hypothetical protein